MRLRSVFLLPVALLLSSPSLAAQRVVIRNGTPDAVVDLLKTYLTPNGFRFVKGDAKAALLTLDLGMLPQTGDYSLRRHSNLFHVVMEFHARFKQKSEGLEISAYEDAVGLDPPGEAFRRRVSSRVEVESIQHLLDQIRGDLESRPVPSDSVLHRDSSRS